MSPNRRKRILEIFQGALNLPSSEIDSFLRRESSSDSGLYNEVLRMLAENAKTEILDHRRSNPAPLPPVFASGQLVADRYRIARFIARGGMGEVYEARDLELGENIALKTLQPLIAADAQMIARFKREIQLSRKISHPNVCRVFDLTRYTAGNDSTDTIYFLTMELLPGETLRFTLERDGPLRPNVALPIIRQMASALDASHQSGVIHRDLKPSNVMLVATPDGSRTVVTDFGLARSYIASGESTRTLTGNLMGTPDYMAPELFKGASASVASDIFAFGVVIYETLTGRKPSSTANGEVLSPSAIVPELPGVWDTIALGCLQADPTKRFSSARAVLSALDSRARDTRFRFPSEHVSRRRTLYLGGAVTALAVGASWFAWPRLDALRHPLPEKKFVALLAWPEEPNSLSRPLIKEILDAIATRLARAEASMKDLLVILPRDVTNQAPPRRPADAAALLGANLVLTANARTYGPGFALTLTVLDSSTGKVLRHDELSSSAAEINHLADKASVAAARLLDVPLRFAEMKDQNELSLIAPAAYLLFSNAEDLADRPNDSGLEQAIETYQKVLETEPTFALGYARLSMAYTRKYQKTLDRAALNPAARNAALALKYNSNSAKGVLSQALVNLYTGNTQQAIDGLGKALQLDPSSPQIMLYKARAFRDLGRHQEEEGVYRAILTTRPNFWPAYNELGWILYRQSKYKEAADAFAEGSAVAPRVALLLTNLGSMYLLLKRTKEAEDAFHRSLDRGPNELAYLNLGSIAFEKRDYRKALKYYGEARDLKPKNDQNWHNIADCYFVLGERQLAIENYATAAKVLSEELHTNPARGSSWMTLGLYEAKLGHRTEAEAALKTAEARGANDVESQFTKAQVLAVLGRRQEALELMLSCMDKGLSTVEVELAVDLNELRADPKYRRKVANADLRR